MQDLTKCSFCKNNNRKTICKKGHKTRERTAKNTIRIGPKNGKCVDYEDDLVEFNR